MALSLSGERSVAAAMPTTPLRAIVAFFARVNADRTRRKALKSLLELDTDRLRDLGLSRADIHEAIRMRNTRMSALVLNTARSREAHR